MPASTDNFELERAVGFYVNRAAYLMSETVARRFAEVGVELTAQDFGILFRLWKQDGLSQKQIANLMMRDKTTITRRLDGLVKKGLIARRVDEHDRRHFCIHLTLAGRNATILLMQVVADFQAEVLADISDADKQITINTLQTMTNTLLRSKT